MAPQGAYFAMAESSSKKPEETADAFLEKWRGLFVSESSSVGFDAIRTLTRRGYTYVRYQQTYAGLEVFTAQMTVEVTNNGGIGAVISDIMTNTESLDNGQVSLNPTVGSSIAQEKASNLSDRNIHSLNLKPVCLRSRFSLLR